MSMQTYYDLKKMLCKELDDMTYKNSKGRIESKEDLEVIDMLTHSIKSVETVIAMNEAQNHGESGYSMPSYLRGGRSNDQHRNTMGQFSRDEYEGGSMRRSRDEGMVEELRELMYRAKDDQTRMKFKNFIMDLEDR